MKIAIFLPLLLNFIICSSNKKPNQWSDESIPPPTTATNSPSFPTNVPVQTWPTDAVPWPPTMSPYPTIVPHIITTGSSKKKLSKAVIITIAVLSAAFLAAVIFAIIFIVRRIRINRLNQYRGILISLSESDLAKTE